MKTVRFSQVVEKAGKPEPYILWVDPKKDRTFQSALKQNRVMMVHQETAGSNADYGTVGFEGTNAGELLMFPKSLKRFENKRVVGVKYGLLEEPPVGKPERPPKALPRQSKKPKNAKEERIISFPKPQREEPKMELAAKKIRSELRKAIQALEDGKAVKAHQLLQALEQSLP